MNNVWEYPLSLKDYRLNLRLREDGLRLDAEIQRHLEAA